MVFDIKCQLGFGSFGKYFKIKKKKVNMLTHSSVNFWPDSHLSEVSRAITTVVWVRMTSSLWLENHKQLVTVRNGLHDLGHGWKDSLFLTHTQNHLRLTHIAKVTQPWAHFPLRLTCFIPFCHTFMCPSLLSVHLSILCPLHLFSNITPSSLSYISNPRLPYIFLSLSLLSFP